MQEDAAAVGDVPYFSQWESAELAARFIADSRALDDDPRWAASGARDVAEYAAWANHVCGMACLKMILAARSAQIWPILDLARQATNYGAYVVEGETIRGMIYAPFVSYLRAAHGIGAEIVTAITAQDLPPLMTRASLFIASVHPWIRTPDMPPPRKGGHLVLVTAAQDDRITFHNPSGDSPETCADVSLPLPLFDRFFAGRGVAILP